MNRKKCLPNAVFNARKAWCSTCTGLSGNTLFNNFNTCIRWISLFKNRSFGIKNGNRRFHSVKSPTLSFFDKRSEKTSFSLECLVFQPHDSAGTSGTFIAGD